MKPTSAAFNADDPRRRYRQQEALCRMIQEGDAQRMVFKGLETVRTD